MPRTISWKRMNCGAMERVVTITWNRAEVLARLRAVTTFRHKKLIAKMWRRMK